MEDGTGIKKARSWERYKHGKPLHFRCEICGKRVYKRDLIQNRGNSYHRGACFSLFQEQRAIEEKDKAANLRQIEYEIHLRKHKGLPV